MLIVQRPQIVEVSSHTCRYHERHPGIPWPGCTCSVAYSSRDKPEKDWTDDERKGYYRALGAID